jgi:hypothetical protein
MLIGWPPRWIAFAAIAGALVTRRNRSGRAHSRPVISDSPRMALDWLTSAMELVLEVGPVKLLGAMTIAAVEAIAGQ